MKRSQILLLGFSIALGIGTTACSTSKARHSGKGQMMNKEMMGKMHHKMMTPEMHEKMAKKHTKAAKCLRSGKSQKECMPMMGKGMMGGKGMGMMKNIDVNHCLNHVKGKTMNPAMMKNMKSCLSKQYGKETTSKDKMSKEEHESHH